jgi:transposase
MAKPLVSDELWAAVEPLLLPDRAKPKGGRPRASDRAALAGIIFVLRTGIPWEYVPREMGVCGMTCWRRLRDWRAAGLWAALHRLLLERLQGADKLNWSRASLDSASVPAKGGDRRPARTRRIAASRVRSDTSSSMARARRSA